MPALMFQGTGSSVGKSLLVAGICRALRHRGLKVAPFKPQNMSNNAAVTVDGGEIGRAQALQARASGLDAHTDMNPVLLKPESETGSQIIVQGRRYATAKASDYARIKPELMPYVMDSFKRLEAQYDLVLVEGAGSPAEINLREGDIANMGFACHAGVKVVLIGDIDRGGVIAQIAGTKAVLDAGDNSQICGFIINKFRGDVRLFDAGYEAVSAHTGWPGFGVIPYFADQWKLPAEDGMDITSKIRTAGQKHKGQAAGLHIVCLRLAHIANFDDLDPLIAEKDVQVTMLEAGQILPADADLVIIPGSKSTIADLHFIRQQGWDIDLAAHHRRGGHILGICGGYQMLGTDINDPQFIESTQAHTKGLGLLDVQTIMTPKKELSFTQAVHLPSGLDISGYEIHIGQTSGGDTQRPFLQIKDRTQGAVSASGRIAGTYLHGMFADDDFRTDFLNRLGRTSQSQQPVLQFEQQIEETLDRLAAHLEQHLDMDALLNHAGM